MTHDRLHHPPLPGLPRWTRIAVLALALICCAAAPPAAHADRGRTLLFGCPASGWPPFILPDGHPAGPGFMLEVFIKAADALGYDVAIRRIPEKRALTDLKNGGIDVFAKAREWVGAPESYLWSAPVIYSTDVLVLRAEDQRPCNSPNDLKGLKVGTVLHYHYPKLQPLFDSGKAHRVDTSCAMAQMHMLSHGNTDVAVINSHVAMWLAKHTPGLSPESFRQADVPLDSAPYRYAFTMARSWGAFIKLLDHEIESMREDGRMEAILDHYR